MVPREQRPISAALQSNIGHSTDTVKGTLKAALNRTLSPRRLRLEFLVKILDLESILGCPLTKLSADERKRVGLARALLKSSRLLLLDETFTALGESCRGQLLPILRRSQDELDLPILYASQSLGEILELTEQLIAMDKGRGLRSGSFGEIGVF